MNGLNTNGLSLWLVALLSMGLAACEGIDVGDGDAGPMGGEGGEGGEGGGVVPDGLSIPGMDGPVTVRFDARSQLNVDCTTDADCFAVQGYYHASHRFIQMDIRRRFVRGTLSEMVGVATLDTDRANRRRMSI